MFSAGTTMYQLSRGSQQTEQAVVENTFNARVGAWERRLAGPRRTLAISAALEAIFHGAVCAIAGSDLPHLNVGRCVLGEICKCMCVASSESAGERSAVVAQISV